MRQIYTLTSSELRLPEWFFSLADQGEGGHVVEEAGLGREPEGEVGGEVPKLGEGEVETNTRDVFQPHLLGVLVGQDVPVAQELENKIIMFCCEFCDKVFCCSIWN